MSSGRCHAARLTDERRQGHWQRLRARESAARDGALQGRARLGRGPRQRCIWVVIGAAAGWLLSAGAAEPAQRQSVPAGASAWILLASGWGARRWRVRRTQLARHRAGIGAGGSLPATTGFRQTAHRSARTRGPLPPGRCQAGSPPGRRALGRTGRSRRGQPATKKAARWSGWGKIRAWRDSNSRPSDP